MDNSEPNLKPLIRIISNITVVIYLLIAAVLTILALCSIYVVVIDLIGIFTAPAVAGGVLKALHSLLATIIIVEILETVIAYFRTTRIQVRPILIAGLTAMIRRVLIFGVEPTDPLEAALTLASIVVLTGAIIYIGREERASG